MFALLAVVLAAASVVQAAKLDQWLHALRAQRERKPTSEMNSAELAEHSATLRGNLKRMMGNQLFDRLDERARQLFAELESVPVEKDEPIRQPSSSRNNDFTLLVCRLADGVSADELVIGDVPLNARARGQLVSFALAVDLLDELAASEQLSACRRSFATTNQGAARGVVVSQADEAARVDQARDVFGVTGRGVKVGIISDSFDRLGGMQDDKMNGDLPADTVILEEFNGLGSDEGRAMAQLVHDLAPDASIVFCSAGNGFFQFADCFGKLADAGCHVIVDDITFFEEAAFQNDVISAAVDAVWQRGVVVFSAAGNSARDSTEGAFAAQHLSNDEPLTLSEEDVQNFFLMGQRTVTDIYTPDPTQQFLVHSWNGGKDGLVRPAGPFDVALPRFYTGTETLVILNFDEPFPDVPRAPSGGRLQVDDFIVDQPRGLVILCGIAYQDGGATVVDTACVFAPGDPFDSNDLDPVVGLKLLFPAGETLVFYTLFSADGFRAPQRFKLFDFSDGVDRRPIGGTFAGFNSQAGTIIGHHNALGAITVGAAFYQETPAFDPSLKTALFEPFSSAGGVPILFDRDSRLAVPIVRQKPDLVCVDGTDTSFFGDDGDDVDGTGFPNFFGTSAAAPHAAAIAALMLELQPTLTPEQIRAALTGSAIDMDVFGFDFNTGHGFCDAVGALQLAANAKPSTAAEETGDETLTFCTRGGQLTAGACDEAKKRAAIVTATGFQRVALQSHVSFRRLSPPQQHHADCGIVATLSIDGKAVWSSAHATSEAVGSIDGHAIVDLEDGTHVASVAFQLPRCTGAKFVLTDPAIVATKIADLTSSEFFNKPTDLPAVIVEGSSSSSSSSD